jgi:hypothetical protein
MKLRIIKNIATTLDKMDFTKNTEREIGQHELLINKYQDSLGIVLKFDEQNYDGADEGTIDAHRQKIENVRDDLTARINPYRSVNSPVLPTEKKRDLGNADYTFYETTYTAEVGSEFGFENLTRLFLTSCYKYDLINNVDLEQLVDEGL